MTDLADRVRACGGDHRDGMASRVLLTVCATFVVTGIGQAQERASDLVTLRGEVIDSAFRPVSGVLVYLSSAGIFSVSDDEGRFELADVERGVDTLQFRAMGFAPRAFRLFLPDSAHGTMELGPLQLVPGPLPVLTLTAAVHDTLKGQPVVGAQVTVNGREVGRTDATGAFTATDVPVEWGINVVMIRSVGYGPLFGTLWVGELQAHKSLTGSMTRAAVDLPAVLVEGERITFAYGRMRDFLQRREKGWGRFFTRADIERWHPTHVSDLVRMVPGFTVVGTGVGTQIRSSRSAGRCGPSIWLDGMRISEANSGGWNIDGLVHPRDIEAMEVYRGSSETPVEFSGGFTDCGAIVIWTR